MRRMRFVEGVTARDNHTLAADGYFEGPPARAAHGVGGLLGGSHAREYGDVRSLTAVRNIEGTEEQRNREERFDGPAGAAGRLTPPNRIGILSGPRPRGRSGCRSDPAVCVASRRPSTRLLVSVAPFLQS